MGESVWVDRTEYGVYCPGWQFLPRGRATRLTTVDMPEKKDAIDHDRAIGKKRGLQLPCGRALALALALATSSTDYFCRECERMGPPFARATVAQKLPDEKLLVGTVHEEDHNHRLILSYA